MKTKLKKIAAIFVTVLMIMTSIPVQVFAHHGGSTYTLNYNANGGVGTSYATTESDNNITVAACTYIRAGYKFVT